MNANRIDFERKYWDQRAKTKDPDREMHDPEISLEEELKIIISGMPDKVDAILEIGCGIGRLTIPLAKEFPKAVVVGIDISIKLLDIAIERSKEPNLWFNSTNGRLIPINDKVIGGKFDFIYCVTLFQHLDEEGVKSYIRAVGESLRTGGNFLFQYIDGQEREPMSNHYYWPDIELWLKEAGMEVQSVREGLIYPIWNWVVAQKVG